MTTRLQWTDNKAWQTWTINNKNDPQKKQHLGTVCKNIFTGGLILVLLYQPHPYFRCGSIQTDVKSDSTRILSQHYTGTLKTYISGVNVILFSIFIYKKLYTCALTVYLVAWKHLNLQNFIRCLSDRAGFNCWIFFALVFSCMYCWVLIFDWSPSFYLDLYVQWFMDKLRRFHANQTYMCLDPHQNWGWGWYCETC